MNYESRKAELEGMLRSSTLTLKTAGELDAARISEQAWKEYREKHYRRP